LIHLCRPSTNSLFTTYVEGFGAWRQRFRHALVIAVAAELDTDESSHEQE
jgi:hypothetical protein